jgi:hypothetical protein
VSRRQVASPPFSAVEVVEGETISHTHLPAVQTYKGAIIFESIDSKIQGHCSGLWYDRP